MAKPKTKESKSMTFRINVETVERLEAFCNDSGQTKTTAVERALNMYFDDYYKKMQILESAEKH